LSIFQFLASNEKLKEIDNPYKEVISINEAIRRNIEIDELMMEGILDKEEKCILICDSEEHLDEIEISDDMYYSSEYAKEYSNKRYFYELRFRYTAERANQLIQYLKDQLNNVDEIEIWNIWLDEHETASLKSINITELSTQDLEFLDSYDKPTCLAIKK
jgi:hypothetical protein